MQTELPKDDPRQIVCDVAEIVGGMASDDFKLSTQLDPCYAIRCDDPVAVAEEAAINGLRGAQWIIFGGRYIVYWPKVTGDSSP